MQQKTYKGVKMDLKKQLDSKYDFLQVFSRLYKQSKFEIVSDRCIMNKIIVGLLIRIWNYKKRCLLEIFCIQILINPWQQY